MSKLLKYILLLLVSWNINKDDQIDIEFELSNTSLLEILQKRDNGEASEINE